MLPNYLREFFLSRIIAGYLRFEDLKIYPPSKDLVYEANCLYCDVYNRCKNEGIMDEVDAMEVLFDNKLWDDESEKQFNYIPEHIDTWKVNIFNTFRNKKECDLNRKYLKTAEEKYQELYSRKNSLNYATCDGIATYAKHQFLIVKTTYKNDKLYNFDKINQHQILSYSQSNIIYESILRELSHNNPWDNIWQAGKKSGNLFGKPSIDLSSEQVRLICWSSMYDNVRENSDCPEDDIVDDNDALDGWLIVQRKEREQRKFEKRTQSKINDKINQADEIYIVADGDTIEDKFKEAKKIDNMNSAYSQMLKRQRFKVIDEKGQVNEAALPDVKSDISMQLTKMFSQSRGK